MDEQTTAWQPAEGARRARELFAESFDGEQPEGVWASPGRVNVIGEHTDYNDGLCLPIALPHRTYVAARRRDDDLVRLVSRFEGRTLTWQGSIDDIAPGGVTGWVACTAGVAWSLRQDGHEIGGFDAALVSCVPASAGLSSSAAVECAVGLALSGLNGLGLEADDAARSRLVDAAVRAENEVVGAPTGGLDQAASLRCQEGHALLLDCQDWSTRQVPFDLAVAGLELLVIDTRAKHSNADGQYGQRRASCEQAAKVLGVDSLRQVEDLGTALAGIDEEVVGRRVRHVVTEIDRVRRVVDLLDEGRIGEVGPLMDQSHDSLRDDYEVTCPELDVAVEAARAAGALGARMTGGGFGGCAIALVRDEDAETVRRGVEQAYADHGFQAPRCYAVTPAAPGGRVD